MAMNRLHFGGPYELKIVKQGEENSEFFQAVGANGIATYAVSSPKLPRLFQFSGATGVVEVSEVFHFCQDDLDMTSVFLLDCFSVLYLWFGNHASHQTKAEALRTAQKYVSKAPDKRPADAPIWVVTQPFQEPPEFTQHFFAWSKSLFPSSKKSLPVCPLLPIAGILKEYERLTYSYEELLSDPLPPGVDPRKLETYLNEDEFSQVFKVSREEFRNLSEWKQETLKRSTYLF